MNGELAPVVVAVRAVSDSSSLPRRARGAGRALVRCSALAASIAACSGGEAARDVVRDSAGVQIVESVLPRWDGESAWRVSAEPLVRIGSVDGGDPATHFTYTPGVHRLSDGRFVVLDGQSAEIRWFDDTGRHVLTRGGLGDGPGELPAASQMLVMPGDTVLVMGGPRMKSVLYGPAGDFIRDEFVDLNGFRALGQWIECLRVMLPDRSILGCQPEEALPRPREAPGHFRSFGRYTVASPELDTAYAVGLYGGIEQWGVDAGNGRTSFFVHPFHSRTHVAVGGSPVRIAIALNPAYSVELWSPTGQLERIVRRRNARRAPTDGERQRAAELMREFERDEPMLNRALAQMQIPDSLPAISNLRIGPAGDLWVARPGIMPEQPRVWDVFDPDGRFLGEVALPHRFILMEVGSDYLLGVRRDELDIPFVELYALTRTGA